MNDISTKPRQITTKPYMYDKFLLKDVYLQSYNIYQSDDMHSIYDYNELTKPTVIPQHLIDEVRILNVTNKDISDCKNLKCEDLRIKAKIIPKSVIDTECLFVSRGMLIEKDLRMETSMIVDNYTVDCDFVIVFFDSKTKIVLHRIAVRSCIIQYPYVKRHSHMAVLEPMINPHIRDEELISYITSKATQLTLLMLKDLPHLFVFETIMVRVNKQEKELYSNLGFKVVYSYGRATQDMSMMFRPLRLL